MPHAAACRPLEGPGRVGRGGLGTRRCGCGTFGVARGGPALAASVAAVRNGTVPHRGTQLACPGGRDSGIVRQAPVVGWCADGRRAARVEVQGSVVSWSCAPRSSPIANVRGPPMLAIRTAMVCQMVSTIGTFDGTTPLLLPRWGADPRHKTCSSKAKLLALRTDREHRVVRCSRWSRWSAPSGVYWWRSAGSSLPGWSRRSYVHEMGHVAALRRFGIAASTPMFIPGLGAVIRSRHVLTTPHENARVGLVGPIWGLGRPLVDNLSLRESGAVPAPTRLDGSESTTWRKFSSTRSTASRATSTGTATSLGLPSCIPWTSFEPDARHGRLARLRTPSHAQLHSVTLECPAVAGEGCVRPGSRSPSRDPGTTTSSASTYIHDVWRHYQAPVDLQHLPGAVRDARQRQRLDDTTPNPIVASSAHRVLAGRFGQWVVAGVPESGWLPGPPASLAQRVLGTGGARIRVVWSNRSPTCTRCVAGNRPDAARRGPNGPGGRVPHRSEWRALDLRTRFGQWPVDEGDARAEPERHRTQVDGIERIFRRRPAFAVERLPSPEFPAACTWPYLARSNDGRYVVRRRVLEVTGGLDPSLQSARAGRF